jgi:tetratricopeptide (TPR) repeat protein
MKFKKTIGIFLLLLFPLMFLSGFKSSDNEGVIYDPVEFTTAIKEFERIVQNQPDNKKAREILLMLKKRQEEKKNAQLYYDEAMKYYRAENYSKAYDYLEKAKKYDPVNPIINKKMEKIAQRLVGEKRFSLQFKDESLKNILLALSKISGMNILLPEDMDGKISIELNNLTFKEALDKVLKNTDYTYEEHKDYVKVIPIEEKIVKEAFSKSEKIYNTSFKEFAFQDVLTTLGKMMKVNIIFDDSVADLKDKKVKFKYEAIKIEWEDLMYRTYTPDFVLHNGIIIETKGMFTAADRRKHLAIKKQHPKLDIRFVFTNSKVKLYKGAKSTYAQWCWKYDFRYCDRIIHEE